MNLLQFLAVLRGRWRLVMTVSLGTLLLVMLVTAVRPAQYTATATVVLDPRPDPVAAPSAVVVATAAYLATQADILRSDRVAQAVVQSLPQPALAHWRPAFDAGSRGTETFENWLAAELRSALVVRLAREGAVLSVEFTAEQPALAAQVANAFVQAYMTTALALRVEPARRFAGFFEERTLAARVTLEQAQARLTAHQKEHGIVLGDSRSDSRTDSRLDLDSARLVELGTQLGVLQAASADSASRQTQAMGQQADRLQEVLGNSAVNQVKGEIGRAEAQLGQLTTQLGDNHPQVTGLRAQLVELRQRLATETQRVAGSVGLTDRINRQREVEMRNTIDAQRGELLRKKAQRDQGLVLQREVEQAQRAYDALVQRLSQSQLESLSTQGQASVLALAQAPAQPSTPRWWLTALLAAILGGLLAVGVAMLLELRCRRLHCGDDVVDALALPLLVTMPRITLQGA